MIRKLGVGLILAMSLVAVACGRQVTPDAPGTGAGGLAPGYMSVKFDTVGPFNYSNYQYWIVFNTSGNGQTPETNPIQTGWSAYNFALEVGGNGASTYANLYQFIKNPAQPGFAHFQLLPTTPQLFQYVANSNGSSTEFTIIVSRTVFQGVAVSPSPSPSPKDSPSPSPPPPSVWLFNAFTTQATQQNVLIFQDSMGSGGATDTSFNSPQLNINTCFDQTFTKLQDINPPTDQSAQIATIEIANNPSPSPRSSPCH
jgi:hypothetical protein